MKVVKLDRLTLRNFKGARDYTLEARGRDTRVVGDNGTGKTTLADAFSWLLFGRDSAGRADFEIKTLDGAGKPVPGLDHEVAAVLLVDGVELRLGKVYRERWSKRRGAATEELVGNTTDHFVDGVPVKAAEFAEAVAGLAPEDVFRLVTDPLEFAERVHWKERRAALLEVCGDVSEADVIASDEQLAELPALLGARTIEQARRVAEARRRELNRELERIPVRIDEVERGTPAPPEAGVAELEAARDRLRASRDENAADLARIAAGGALGERTKALRELEAEILHIDKVAAAGAQDALADLQRELGAAIARRDETQRELDGIRDRSRRRAATMIRLDAEVERLRVRWAEIDEAPAEPPAGETECPACGRELPADTVTAARETARAFANRQKAEALDQVDRAGAEVRAELRKLEAAAVDAREAERVLEGWLAERSVAADEAADAVARARDTSAAMRSDPEREAKVAEVAAIRAEIEDLRADGAAVRDSLAEAAKVIDAELDRVGRDLAAIAARRAAADRIEELMAAQRELAGELEGVERLLYLAERFTRAKVRMLEERINGRFDLARFRLFDELVNGSLSECCEVTFEGVPWRSLNHGARIRVGLDIVRTLQRFHGVAPPVFVDQAESVTRLDRMPFQTIELEVRAGAPVLHVEYIATEGKS